MDYGTKYIDIVKKIVLSNIDKKETCVFLFGSRADKSSSSRSDIDIGIKCKNDLGKTRYRILNAIEESNVPYKVDLVDLTHADDDFKKTIAGSVFKIWNKPKDLSLKELFS
jgi:predicted nucleotidyltransferase